jgi:hypothetical protein
MFDGFWHGLFGGLFGPALAQWMSRFRYWVIFLVVTLSVHIGLFVMGTFAKGLQFAIQVTIKNTLTPAGILAPMAIGLLAVFVAFIGSLNTPQKKIREADGENERK